MSIPTKRLKYGPAHDRGRGEITVSIKQVTQTTVISTLVSAPDHISQHTLVSAPNHHALHQLAHVGFSRKSPCITSARTCWFQPQISVHYISPHTLASAANPRALHQSAHAGQMESLYGLTYGRRELTLSDPNTNRFKRTIISCFTTLAVILF